MPIESLGTPVRSAPTPQSQRLREAVPSEPRQPEKESSESATAAASETDSAPTGGETGKLSSLRGNVVDFYA